jgi:hypothetical protein
MSDDELAALADLARQAGLSPAALRALGVAIDQAVALAGPSVGAYLNLCRAWQSGALDAAAFGDGITDLLGPALGDAVRCGWNAALAVVAAEREEPPVPAEDGPPLVA